MMRKLSLIVCAVLIQGCASTTKQAPLVTEAPQESQLRAVHVDLVEQMIRQENYHAALAHIEELQRGERKDDKLLLLHARVMFKLGHINEAHNEYLQLLDGPFEAEALHGIGLIHAINNPTLSLEYLARASEGRPTDASIRNDYGYALLRKGQYSQASLNLSTAHELSPEEAKYRNNALLALLILNDDKAAERMAEKQALPSGLLKRIRGEARQWQLRGEAATESGQKDSQSQSSETAEDASKDAGQAPANSEATVAQRS
ncbi:MAG: tetratricopeptide repeat protein [Nevskiales bacterium]